MKVKDLIVKLSLINPELPVFINKTNPNMEFFKFGSIIDIAEVETPLDGEIVIISDEILE